MKNLDLNKYDVQEMNNEEMKAVEGGGWGSIVAFGFFGGLIGFLIGGPVGAAVGAAAGAGLGAL